MVDVFNCLRRVFHGINDFESFMITVVVILFSALFVRVLIACMMGNWSIF